MAAPTAATARPALPDLDALLASGAIRLPGTRNKGAGTDSGAASSQAQVPDFRLYTAAAAIDPDQKTSPETGNPLVHAIGSSTIQDLQGDVMELSALQDMQKAPPGLALFVNHSYETPEDLVARLYDYPTIAMKREIADLALVAELLPKVNPRAAQLYAGIEAGVRQGVSIGCMITQAAWCDADGNPIPDDEIDWWDIIEGKIHLHIQGVDPLEWSFVGIPANQRSWVQYAAQGLFRRALAAGDARAAQRLSPLVKAWFPTEFTRDVLSLAATDAALRKTVEQTAPRRDRVGTQGRQIVWRPDSATFGLRNSSARTVKEISRERVAEILAGETTAAAVDPVVPPVAADSVDPVVEKQATGKSDWPLGERDAAWDNGAAHTRIVEWAGGTDDPDVGKLKSVHFYTPDDQGDQKSVSKYKLLFCDVVGGSVKAMPRALMACWGAHGVEAADIPAEDKDAIKKKLSAYAARMRKEFDDDTIMPPWDKEDSAEPESANAETEVAESSAAGGADLEIKADGSHAAYSGTHTHAHAAFGSQGGDETHAHEHSHDGDADHDHHSGSGSGSGDDGDDKSAAAPEQVATQEAPEPVQHATAAAATAAAPDPARAAALASLQTLAAQYGFTVLDATSGAVTLPLTAEGGTSASASAPVRKCMLTDNDDDAQRVISLVSDLDMHLDAASRDADEVMAILRIPDADGDNDYGAEGEGSASGEPDNSDVAGPRYPADGSEVAGVGESAVESAAAFRLIRAGLRMLQRSGARHSAADMASLQRIHDEVYALTDGAVCKGAQSGGEGEGEGEGGEQSADAGASVEGSDLRSLDAAPITRALHTALTDLTTTLKGADGINAAFAALDAKAKALDAAVAQAAETQAEFVAEWERRWQAPMGRPTLSASRTYSASGVRAVGRDADPAAVATSGGEPIPSVTADALTAEGAAAERTRATAAAKALTTTQYVRGVGQCRLWPAGIGMEQEGVRPAITREQRMVMEQGFMQLAAALPADARPTSAEALIAAYTSGIAPTLIPIVFDGE